MSAALVCLALACRLRLHVLGPGGGGDGSALGQPAPCFLPLLQPSSRRPRHAWRACAAPHRGTKPPNPRTAAATAPMPPAFIDHHWRPVWSPQPHHTAPSDFWSSCSRRRPAGAQSKVRGACRTREGCSRRARAWRRARASGQHFARVQDLRRTSSSLSSHALVQMLSRTCEHKVGDIART